MEAINFAGAFNKLSCILCKSSLGTPKVKIEFPKIEIESTCTLCNTKYIMTIIIGKLGMTSLIKTTLEDQK